MRRRTETPKTAATTRAGLRMESDFRTEGLELDVAEQPRPQGEAHADAPNQTRSWSAFWPQEVGIYSRTKILYLYGSNKHRKGFLDGRRIDRTPLGARKLPVGTYELRLRDDRSGTDRRLSVSILQDKRSYVDVR